jgi:molecular chaperone DnaK
VDIKVYQGEREFARDNRLLGSFLLEGIPPAPRGVPQIEVSFDIDANGILNVSAKDLGTGKEKSIRITSSSGLSKEEVEKMRKDAQTHAAEDTKKREVVNLKNESDNAVYRTEKLLKEHAGTVSDKDKTRINAILDRLKSARDKEDVAGMKKIMEELSEATQEIGKAIYEKAARGGSGSSGARAEEPPPSEEKRSKGGKKQKEDETIIDADYEVKD